MRLLIAFFLASLIFPGPAFSISDADFENMRKNSNAFKQADASLNKARKSLSKTEEKALLPDQKEW